MRALGTLGILLTLAIVAACTTTGDDGPRADDEATGTAGTEADPSPTATPVTEQPTPVPSGAMLRLDGIAAQQVVLWDSALPAEFATTRYTLYHRSDARTWSRVDSLPTEGNLVADPTDPDRLYLGDHPPCLRGGDPVPFHRSEDGGESWQEVPNAENIRPMTVLPDQPNVVIGSRCGLAISQDYGVTWERHLPDSEFDLTRLTITEIGIFGTFTSHTEISYLRRITIDDPDNPEFDEPILSFWGTGAMHATGERLIVGTISGVHFSDDGGRTWSFTREGLDDVVASVDPLEQDIPEAEIERGLGIHAVLPHPQQSSRIFLGTVRGLYLSEDNGESWGRIPEVDEREVRALDFAMEGSILYVTTADGVIVLHNP